MCTLKCYHMTYTMQSERGIHMEIAIMILGICAVILLAAAFFGILKKAAKTAKRLFSPTFRALKSSITNSAPNADLYT